MNAFTTMRTTWYLWLIGVICAALAFCLLLIATIAGPELEKFSFGVLGAVCEAVALGIGWKITRQSTNDPLFERVLLVISVVGVMHVGALALGLAWVAVGRNA